MSRNNHPKAISFQPALREWHLGKLEGSKISTMADIYPKQLDAFKHNLAKFNNDIFDASLSTKPQNVLEVLSAQ